MNTFENSQSLRDNNISAKVGLFIGLCPIWWLLGFDILIYTVVLSSLYLFNVKVRYENDLWSNFVLLFIAYMSIRLLFYFVDTGEVFRSTASLYNTIILATLLISYKITMACARLENWSLPFVKNLTKVFWLIAPIFLLFMAFVLLTNQNNIVFPSLLGLITPDSKGIIEAYRKIQLIGIDWATGNPLPRPSFLGPFATTSAFIFTFLITAVCIHGAKKYSRTIVLFLELVAIIILVATLTRTSAGGFLIGSVLAAILFFTTIARLKIIFLLGFVLIGASSLGLIDFFENFRTGSNSTRFNSYNIAIDYVMETNPLFGLGIKPRDDSITFIPIGSHSSYISFLIKGGLIGALLFVITLVIIPAINMLKLIRINYNNNFNWPQKYMLFALCRQLIVINIFFLFEDIDAFMLASVLTGIYFAWLNIIIKSYSYYNLVKSK